VLTLGQQDHFLKPDRKYEECPHHDFATAERDGHGLLTPVVSPSLSHPPTTPLDIRFIVRVKSCDTRRDRCKIIVVETALCCRACSFRDSCWTEKELSTLPCGRLLKGRTQLQLTTAFRVLTPKLLLVPRNISGRIGRSGS
jgi:hypothetical protein